LIISKTGERFVRGVESETRWFLTAKGSIAKSKLVSQSFVSSARDVKSGTETKNNGSTLPNPKKNCGIAGKTVM
jgi:hypothetical protein